MQVRNFTQFLIQRLHYIQSCTRDTQRPVDKLKYWWNSFIISALLWLLRCALGHRWSLASTLILPRIWEMMHLNLSILYGNKFQTRLSLIDKTANKWLNNLFWKLQKVSIWHEKSIGIHSGHRHRIRIRCQFDDHPQMLLHDWNYRIADAVFIGRRYQKWFECHSTVVELQKKTIENGQTAVAIHSILFGCEAVKLFHSKCAQIVR